LKELLASTTSPSFDRRFHLADGSRIEQCDGTAWMASLSLNLLTH
jgi:hypothetical protein